MSDHPFRDLEEAWESGLPDDLEDKILQQVNNFSVFGSVVELFIPNALDTAARLIGGDGGPRNQGGSRGNEPDPLNWRIKPR